MNADKYTIGSGANCDYLYLNGKHLLKTVGDSIATTTEARKACAMLNQFDALTKVAKYAKRAIKDELGDNWKLELGHALAELERAKEGK